MPATDTRPRDARASQRPDVPRRVRVGAVIGTSLVVGLAIAAGWTPEPERSAEADLYAQFCTPVPPAAAVAAGDAAHHQVAVQVPRFAQAPDLQDEANATQVARGEVVEIRIRAPFAGAASVHGLSDLVVMKADEPATLRFRAIYSGRFPLHFHGADGSHYGVWALNISTPTTAP